MKRGLFSLSNTKLASFDMGELVPVGLQEVLPGDTFQQSTNVLLRASPLLAPVYHPVDMRIHHWFVPHRLVWDSFEDFITGGPDGNDASVFPTIDGGETGFAVGSLADYLGVPTAVADGPAVSALPFRAYQLIWNEFYRDQDLETAATISTADDADSTTDVTLQNCSWEKDYFTSARPWEQKGPSITIPIGDEAPVLGIAKVTNQFTTAGSVTDAYQSDGTQVSYANDTFSDIDGSTANERFVVEEDGSTGYPNIRADLSGVSGIAINALREAMALQSYEEARAMYGSRYTEYLRYLQVPSSDSRLQRPEYLGGGRNTFQWSEVLQTAQDYDANTGVGTIRGHGIGAVRSNRYRRYFNEHGYVMSLMSVRPKTIYADGLSRHWNRRLKEDFWQKELQTIGQQEVLNKEVRAAHASPDDVFGYQDRYDEYRRAESSIAGQFRGTELDFWHFARLFGSDPSLNASFVSCVPPVRPFAVQTEDVLWAYVRHSVQARRLVMQTGRPRSVF